MLCIGHAIVLIVDTQVNAIECRIWMIKIIPKFYINTSNNVIRILSKYSLYIKIKPTVYVEEVENLLN